MNGQRLVSLDFHPLFFFLMFTFHAGTINFWDFHVQSTKKKLTPSSKAMSESIISLDKYLRRNYLPEYVQLSSLAYNVTYHSLHPKENMLGFQFTVKEFPLFFKEYC